MHQALHRTSRDLCLRNTCSLLWAPGEVETLSQTCLAACFPLEEHLLAGPSRGGGVIMRLTKKVSADLDGLRGHHSCTA